MKKSTSFGYSSILITFVMICIVTFSALALLTANADYQLSKKVANRNLAYYQAEAIAYEKLSQIDQTLQQCYLTSADATEYYVHLQALLIEGTWRSADNNTYEYCYSVTIDDTSQLQVVLNIAYPAPHSDRFYSIQEWRDVISEPDFEEEPLNLLH